MPHGHKCGGRGQREDLSSFKKRRIKNEQTKRTEKLERHPDLTCDLSDRNLAEVKAQF